MPGTTMADELSPSGYTEESELGFVNSDQDESNQVDLTATLTSLLSFRLSTRASLGRGSSERDVTVPDSANLHDRSATAKHTDVKSKVILASPQDVAGDSRTGTRQEGSELASGSGLIEALPSASLITVDNHSEEERTCGPVEIVSCGGAPGSVVVQHTFNEARTGCKDIVEKAPTGDGKKGEGSVVGDGQPCEIVSDLIGTESTGDALCGKPAALTNMVNNSGEVGSHNPQSEEEVFTNVPGDPSIGIHHNIHVCEDLYTPDPQQPEAKRMGPSEIIDQTRGRDDVEGGSLNETSNHPSSENCEIPIEIILRDRNCLLAEDHLFLQTMWDDASDTIESLLRAQENTPPKNDTVVQSTKATDHFFGPHIAPAGACVSGILTCSHAYACVLSGVLRIASEALVSHGDIILAHNRGSKDGVMSTDTEAISPHPRSGANVSVTQTSRFLDADCTEEIDTTTLLHQPGVFAQDSQITQTNRLEATPSLLATNSTGQAQNEAPLSTGMRWKELAGQLVCETLSSIRELLLAYRSLCRRISERYKECAQMDLPTNVNDLDWDALMVLDICTLKERPLGYDVGAEGSKSDGVREGQQDLGGSVQEQVKSAIQMYELVKSHCIRRLGVLSLYEYTHLQSVHSDGCGQDSMSSSQSCSKVGLRASRLSSESTYRCAESDKSIQSGREWILWVEDMNGRMRTEIQKLRGSVNRYNAFGAYGKNIGKVKYKAHGSFANESGKVSQTTMSTEATIPRLNFSAEGLVSYTRGLFMRALHCQETTSEVTALYLAEDSQTLDATAETHRSEGHQRDVKGEREQTIRETDGPCSGIDHNRVIDHGEFSDKHERSHTVVPSEVAQPAEIRENSTISSTVDSLQLSIADVDIMCGEVHGLLKALQKHRRLLERSVALIDPNESGLEDDEHSGDADTILCEDAANTGNNTPPVARGMEVGEFDIMGDEDYTSDEDEDRRAMKRMSREERIQYMAAKKRREAQARLDASAPLIVMSELQRVLKQRSKYSHFIER